MAIRVLKSVPSAQSVVKKLFASFEQLFAVLYLFSGAHHPFGGRVQINFRIINGNSCSKYTVNPCAKSILCSNKNGGWD